MSPCPLLSTESTFVVLVSPSMNDYLIDDRIDDLIGDLIDDLIDVLIDDLIDDLSDRLFFHALKPRLLLQPPPPSLPPRPRLPLESPCPQPDGNSPSVL